MTPLGGSKSSRFVDEMRIQIWRRTELLQMPTVSHVGSQVLGKVRHRLVSVFCGSSSHLRGEFQLISRLRVPLEFIVFFEHGAADVVVQPRAQIWRRWGHSFFSMDPFAFSQFCMTLER